MRTYKGTVNNTEIELEVHNGTIKSKDFSCELEETDGELVARVGNEVFPIDFVHKVDSETYIVGIQGYTFDVNLKDPMQAIMSNDSEKSGKIVSPMAGVITSITAKEGKEVKEGDVLLVLSAMKMENEIVSPVDGKVKKIHCEKDGQVTPGQLLLEIHTD